MGLIQSPKETQQLALEANPNDEVYLVPAFTGLGAPYWNSDARAMIYGMSRTTGRKEIVKAAVESIAYQIADIVNMIRDDEEMDVKELCVDGGPTGNGYLMKFQSDILGLTVTLPRCEESSAQGAAFMAGLCCGFYTMETIEARGERTRYYPSMDEQERVRKYQGWKTAVNKVLS